MKDRDTISAASKGRELFKNTSTQLPRHYQSAAKDALLHELLIARLCGFHLCRLRVSVCDHRHRISSGVPLMRAREPLLVAPNVNLSNALAPTLRNVRPAAAGSGTALRLSHAENLA